MALQLGTEGTCSKFRGAKNQMTQVSLPALPALRQTSCLFLAWPVLESHVRTATIGTRLSFTEDLVLDEENRRVRPVCCWSYLFAVLCPHINMIPSASQQAIPAMVCTACWLASSRGWLAAVADTSFFEQGYKACGKALPYE